MMQGVSIQRRSSYFFTVQKVDEDPPSTARSAAFLVKDRVGCALQVIKDCYLRFRQTHLGAHGPSEVVEAPWWQV